MDQGDGLCPRRATDNFVVYIDGAMAGQNYKFPGPLDVSSVLFIGNLQANVPSFNCTLDFLAIYPSAMQADAVRDLYQGEMQITAIATDFLGNRGNRGRTATIYGDGTPSAIAANLPALRRTHRHGVVRGRNCRQPRRLLRVRPTLSRPAQPQAKEMNRFISSKFQVPGWQVQSFPGDLRGLAAMFGYASLNTVMAYTKPRLGDLAARMERAG